MALFARSALFIVLTIASMSCLSEGLCFQSDEDSLKMCVPGTRTGTTLFIDANKTLSGTENCSCSFTHSVDGNVEISYIKGSRSPSGYVNVDFYHDVTQPFFYRLSHTTTQGVVRRVPTNEPVRFDLWGNGFIDACITLQVQRRGAELTVTCKQQTVASVTVPLPPTTQQPPQTPKPATTKLPGPVTTPPKPETTKPPGPITTPPKPMTTQPPGPTTQPPVPTTQPPGPVTQPPVPTTQPPGPVTQPPGPSTQPPSPAKPTPTPPLPPMGSTAQAYKFPVVEVATGVGGGIILIILLVIIVTCCTSRRTKRSPDEESLKSHESQSPRPEMTEKQEGYAFDNLVYHSTHTREGSSKSFTSTVSEADTNDDEATKGLEELYRSVNRNITDSTDIM